MQPADFLRARNLLRPFLSPTRLIPAPALSHATEASVYLKLESEGPTGSFKVRGALHSILINQQRRPLSGLVTSSTGNHGAAVAYVARLLKLPAAVFLPVHPNPVKRANIAALGAEIHEAGRDYDEARDHAAAFARQRGWFFLEDGRDPDMTPGTATIACEIIEQLPAAEVIFVPVGDTTLIRGIAAAAKHLKPSIRIVGIQSARFPAYYRSWKENRVISTDTADTSADGLAVRCPTEENVREIRRLVDEMRLVSEEEILRAVARLILEEHIVAEPSGVASTAGLLQFPAAYAGKNVVLLVTGANLTPGYLRLASSQFSNL